jgi:hypothetical protein
MTISTRLFVAASAACGTAWLLKTAVIAANGGSRTSGGVIGVLWATGTVCLMVAAAAGTMSLLRRRPTWLRVLAGLAAIPLSFTLLSVIDALVKAVYPGSGWFHDELSLVLVGALMAGGALAAVARRSERGVSVPAG